MIPFEAGHMEPRADIRGLQAVGVVSLANGVESGGVVAKANAARACGHKGWREVAATLSALLAPFFEVGTRTLTRRGG
jgi:hypothetical protein